MQVELKKGAGISSFFFITFFFILCMFIAPSPEGQYRLPKIYFFLFSLVSFIPLCLIKERRWIPFCLFASFAFITLLKFQFKWSFFTLFIYYVWLTLIVTLEKMDYEEKFLSVLYVISLIWIAHAAIQWFGLDPITVALDPVTRLPTKSIADPVIAFIGNPTWAGPTFAMCIPLVLMRRFGLLVAAGLFVATVLTDSSGGILTAIVVIGCLIIFPTSGKISWKKMLILFTGLLGCLIIVYYFYPMRAIYGSGGWFDENFRFRAWRDAWGFTKQVKWIGWGFGSWMEIFPQLTIKSYQAVWQQAHSDLVQNYFETGIVGSIFVLWATFNVLSSKVVDRRGYFYLSAILGISVDALVSFPFHLPITAVLTAVCLERYFYYSQSRDILKPVLKKTGRFIYDRRLLPQRWAKCTFKKC